jgi:hypothetical protein
MTYSNDRWGKTPYLVEDPSGWKHDIVVSGRERWALETLMSASATGCTSLSAGAHRLASYVCRLRDKGVLIATEREEHGGDFPGAHARYYLLATVVRAETEVQA